MANPIQNREIADERVFETLIQEGRQLIKVIDSMTKKAAKFGDEAEKSIANLDVKSTQDLQKLNQLLKQLETTSKEVTAAQKQRAKTVKELGNAEVQLQRIQQQKLRTLKEERAAELATNRVKIQKRKEAERQEKIAERERRQQEKLNDAYGRASQRLNTLRKRYRNLALAGKENTTVGRNLLRNITALDGKLKAIDKTVGQNFRNVGNYSSAFQGLRKGLVSTVGALGLAGGAIQAVTRALSESFKIFSNFGLAVSKVEAVSGATKDEIAALKDEAKLLGSTTEFTASQVANLQLNFARGGFSPDEIQGVTKATLDLATATGSTLDEASRVAASNIRAFGLSSDDTEKFVNTLTTTLNRSNQQLGDFAEASKVFAPTAKLLGISVEEASATIGILADNGLRGTDATTALASSLTRLADDTKQYSKAAEGLGVEVFNQQGEFVGLAQLIENLSEVTADYTDEQRAAAISQIFGQRAIKQVSTLLDAQKEVVTENGKEFLTGSDAIRGFAEELDNTGNSAERTASIIQDNLAGDVNKFKSALEGAVLEGEGLNTVFRFFVQVGTRLISVLQDVFKPFTDVFKSVGKLAEALGLFSEKGDAAASTAQFIGATFKIVLLPLTLIQKALSLVIDAITFLIKESKELGEELGVFEALGEIVDSIAGFFERTGEKVDEFIDRFPILRKVVDAVSDALEATGDFLNDLGDDILEFLGFSDELQDENEETAESFDEAAKSTQSFAESLINAEAKVQRFADILSAGSTKLREFADSGEESNKVLGFFADLAEAAKEGLEGLFTAQKNIDAISDEFGEKSIKAIRSQITELNKLLEVEEEVADRRRLQIRIDQLTAIQKALIAQANGEANANKIVAGSLEDLRRQVSELTKQRDKISKVNKDAIEQKNIQIATINEEIKALEALGKARDEATDPLENTRELEADIEKELTESIIAEQERRNKAIQDLQDRKGLDDEVRRNRIEKAESDFQNKLTRLELGATLQKIENLKQAQKDAENITNEDDRLKAQEDLLLRELDLQKKANDLELKLVEDQQGKIDDLNEKAAQKAQEQIEALVSLTEQGLKSLETVTDLLFENQIKKLDEQITEIDKREAQLQSALEKGAKNTEGSLAELDKERAKALNEKERALKNQARVELAISTLQTFGANVEAGVENPLTKTFVDVLALRSFWQSLPLFPAGGNFHGTDDTGTAGNVKDNHGTVTGWVHENEQVWSKADRSQVGWKSREEIKDLVQIGEMASTMPDIAIDRPSISVQNPYVAIDRLERIEQVIKDLPDRLPRQSFNYDDVNKMAVDVVESKNKVERYHKRPGGLYG